MEQIEELYYLFLFKKLNKTLFKLKGIEEHYYLHLFKLVGPF